MTEKGFYLHFLKSSYKSKRKLNDQRKAQGYEHTVHKITRYSDFRSIFPCKKL